MIKIIETDFPESLRKKHEAQRRFFARKLRRKPHFWAVGGVTVALVASISASVLSLRWWIVALLFVVPILAVINRIDEIRWRKTWRESLEWHQREISARIVEVQVDAIEFWEFEELEDEGAALLFHDADDDWIFIFGQDFYPSRFWPCLSFTIRFSPHGGHLETLPKSERVDPTRRIDGHLKESLIPRNGTYEVLTASPDCVLEELRRRVAD